MWTTQRVIWIVVQLVVVVFSIMVHEISHGLAAYRLGDPTAKNAGRLTLNPVRHLDPFGSIILPALMTLASGPVFAYAKPVPYNPRYFKNRRKGELIVALAGPFSNLVQALLGAGMAQAAYLAYPDSAGVLREVFYWVYNIGYLYCLINLVLMFFNLIPLPPLDGSTVIAVLLPQRYMEAFYTFKQYSMFILLCLLFLVPMVTPWDPLSWYMQHTAYALTALLVP